MGCFSMLGNPNYTYKSAIVTTITGAGNSFD